MRRQREKSKSMKELKMVSLKTISELVDANRSTVRRWLGQAGINPVALGRGRNGAVRFYGRDVEQWLTSQEKID